MTNLTLLSVWLLFNGGCYGPVPPVQLTIPGVSFVGKCPAEYQVYKQQDPPNDQIRLALYATRFTFVDSRTLRMHSKQPNDALRGLCLVVPETGRVEQCVRLTEPLQFDPNRFAAVHVVCGQGKDDYAWLLDDHSYLVGIAPLRQLCWWRCEDLNQRLCASITWRKSLGR